MRCNQRFFGQEHFENGTPQREFATSLSRHKPLMLQYGFAEKDKVPELPSDAIGVVQVKYNGMLSILIWDEARQGFVAWNPRGRIYYSLDDHRKHPVTEFLNKRFIERKDTVFIGETYVVRDIGGKSYMTEFNKSMSIIKNPMTPNDVQRIRLAIFDYRSAGEAQTNAPENYLNRLSSLVKDFQFPTGCDSGAVHVADFLAVDKSFKESQSEVQSFWDEYIGKRGFEGLVMHTTNGERFKIKFRDTLDAVIIAFRMMEGRRRVCEKCGTRFDAFWLRKLVKDGKTSRTQWFDGARLKSTENLWNCPFCGGELIKGDGPIFGAKIALMTPEGKFVDVADGAQLSDRSLMLDLFEPLYESDGYLWVKPQVVIEVVYQDLYIDRARPLYSFDGERYCREGEVTAFSLRPYRPRYREDKTVNPLDLRLEQVSHLSSRVKGIQRKASDR